MILIKRFFAYNELRNYSYLVLDKDSGHSWVIDPYDAGPMIDYIKKNGLVLKGILNTHQHFDHVRGNTPLSDTFGAPVRRLRHSEKINLSSEYSLETLDTPGHTVDHQVFVWKEGSRPVALFSGDTLFNSGVGNCKNGGDVDQLFETTLKLMNTLPSDTVLYPGHDYRKRNLEFAAKVEPENSVVRMKLDDLEGEKTEDLPPVSLGEERMLNPFLRLQSEEIRQNLLGRNEINERQLFKELRKLRDQW